ncbi:alpha/beta hydrolase [Actinomadura rugatobispora]|uniref:Alpha/beta hydrolase n=1 Tax=Actinomadura rugatobispora TaxID=1994 RepID=A0ABW1AHL0_9ACTN|nr:alpha/beta hydrolase [Actinomadura rugatobispora]
MSSGGPGDSAATAEAPAPPGGDDAVRSRVVDVGGIPMSALVRAVDRPRAVIVALHGGSARAAYFHAPALAPQSLLLTGAALGFTVIALDRPGYGASAAHADRMTDPRSRVDLAYAAVDRLLGAGPRGAGVFVMAHSLGSVLALRMAADERGPGLLGLELAGTGLRFHPPSVEILDGRLRDRPREPGRLGLRDILWGPEHLYPEDVEDRAAIASSTPAYEADEVRTWTGRLPGVAVEVRVPVRYCLGDHELVWDAEPSAMAGVAALFTASPRVVVDRQVYGPHNLSLGRSATAYHLKVLAFAEECVLAREGAGSAGDRTAADDAAAPGR